LKKVEAIVVEELPSLLYRLELSNRARILAHGAGAVPSGGLSAGGVERNWVRLLPGDRVEVEFAEHDLTRGRIIRKIGQVS
jgi:translation initiation factor IF-1